MSSKNDSIPLAYAVPVESSGGQQDGSNLSIPLRDPSAYIVPIQVGLRDLGLEVHGQPPRVVKVDKSSPLFEYIQQGHFIHGVLMPDVQIVNVTDWNYVTRILDANTQSPRSLLMGTGSCYVDDYNLGPGSTYCTLYKHTLPTTSNLGIGMRGFPPAITHVHEQSPLYGRVQQWQTVEALMVPGEPVRNLQSGAFTDAKVLEALQESSHIQGRVLILKDVGPKKREKGSSRPVDDCAVM